MIAGEAVIKKCSDYTDSEFSDCNELLNKAFIYPELVKRLQPSTYNLTPSDSVGIVLFDPAFSAFLNQDEDVRVLVTPTSPVVGNIYVAGKNIRGFVVKELNAQDYGATFDWIFIGKIKEGSDNKVENILEETDGNIVNSVANAGSVEQEVVPNEIDQNIELKEIGSNIVDSVTNVGSVEQEIVSGGVDENVQPQPSTSNDYIEVEPVYEIEPVTSGIDEQAVDTVIDTNEPKVEKDSGSGIENTPQVE